MVKAKQLDSVPRALGQEKTLFYQERKVFQKSETKIEILFFKNFMNNFTTYLSTAPVVALAWLTITAGLLIEINRFFPDPLVFSF